MAKKTIITQRLILRPWRVRDAAHLYEYAKDPQVGPAAGWPPHTDVAHSREIIRTVFCAPHTFAVCRREDGVPVGSIGLKMGEATDLTDRPDECELGYWIGRPFWGQGLIPEAVNAILEYAFTTLGMQTVWCGYYDGNDKSKRVQEKCGFIYHHTTQDVEVPLLGEVRVGHVNFMTADQWRRLQEMKQEEEK